jgi:hypothetical protein
MYQADKTATVPQKGKGTHLTLNLKNKAELSYIPEHLIFKNKAFRNSKQLNC